MENSQVAFHKSILSSDAIKNPLIYLNYSIFSLEVTQNFEMSQQYLNNFYNICETMKVPNEVSINRNKCKLTTKSTMLLNFNHFQYMQIAENVLSKLPSSTLVPQRTQQLKETKITEIDGEKNLTNESVKGADEKSHHDENEEDLV